MFIRRKKFKKWVSSNLENKFKKQQKFILRIKIIKKTAFFSIVYGKIF